MAHVKAQLLIPATQMEVFRYVTDPSNLNEQLASNIQLTWLNPGTTVQAGAEFSFSMKRLGIEQPVRFRIDKYVVGYSLTYHQLEGLFHTWVHSMKFEEHAGQQTLVTDLVDYEMPFGLMGRVVDDFWWRKDLHRILMARLEFIRSRFESRRDTAAVSNGN